MTSVTQWSVAEYCDRRIRARAQITFAMAASMAMLFTGCSSDGDHVASRSFALSGGVCPPVGADTDCGTILTIGDTGPVAITTTGQGPYDQIEDTLIGVVNNSSHPLRALGLSSSLPIFAFDG